MWMMLAQAAASGIKAKLDNDRRKKEIKAQNKAAKAADDRTIANAYQEVSSYNLQNGMLRVQAAKELQQADKMAYSAQGTVAANAAAAQVKGASVDAVINDIDRELGEARVATEQSLEAGQYNIQNSIRSVVQSASSALLGQQNPYANQSSPLLATLSTLGSSYLNNQMKFGGGSGFSFFGGGTPTPGTPAAGTAETFAAPSSGGFTINS
ncbi:internal virion protein [Pseudomonas phage phi2]|uniref:Predicted phage virion protein n=1 Tax=Pseudomonas phage phi2 TaxID=1450169 RepID=D2EBT7_9CAUD|nr:internal virion protein [Pseudomonas phage phi-2]CBH51603.1 predicted phage virion protein [Pseudomonas phage phi-2]